MLSFTGGILVPAYTASKSAIMGLTEGNGQTSCQARISTSTPSRRLHEDAADAGDARTIRIRNKEVLDRLPIGYWGDPSVLQGPVVFLASEASDYICGRDNSC